MATQESKAPGPQPFYPFSSQTTSFLKRGLFCQHRLKGNVFSIHDASDTKLVRVLPIRTHSPTPWTLTEFPRIRFHFDTSYRELRQTPQLTGSAPRDCPRLQRPTSPRPADQLGYIRGVPITSSVGSIANWNRSPDSEKRFPLAVYYKGTDEPPHEEVPEARSGRALSVAVPAPTEGVCHLPACG